VTNAFLDAHGRIVAEDAEQDLGADGTIDYRYVFTAAYDQDGHLSELVRITEGAVGSNETLRTIAFDQQGHPSQQVSTYTQTDGFQERSTLGLLYDRKGNVVRETKATDRGIDGTIDSRSVKRDEAGNAVPHGTYFAQLRAGRLVGKRLLVRL
jgi:hypothetical protein